MCAENNKSSRASLSAKLENCHDELGEAREEATQFISSLRHGMSQPLTALRCGLEISARLPLNEQQLRERMIELLAEVDRIATVLDKAEEQVSWCLQHPGSSKLKIQVQTAEEQPAADKKSIIDPL